MILSYFSKVIHKECLAIDHWSLEYFLHVKTIQQITNIQTCAHFSHVSYRASCG